EAARARRLRVPFYRIERATSRQRLRPQVVVVVPPFAPSKTSVSWRWSGSFGSNVLFITPPPYVNGNGLSPEVCAHDGGWLICSQWSLASTLVMRRINW